MKTTKWLLETSQLWIPSGGIIDGIRKNGSFDRTTHTYNQAVILKLLTELRIVLNDETYLTKALKIVEFVMNNLVDKNTGLLCEMVKEQTPRSHHSKASRSFKGIVSFFAVFPVSFAKICSISQEFS